jgi:hypothetical protein
MPLRKQDLVRELAAYFDWYAEHRPHTHLRGRTPNEVYFGRRPANEVPRLEPRLKYPRDPGTPRQSSAIVVSALPIPRVLLFILFQQLYRDL